MFQIGVMELIILLAIPLAGLSVLAALYFVVRAATRPTHHEDPPQE